jgi:HSP20 family protein
MAEAATKLPLKSEQPGGTPVRLRAWEPFEGLWMQIDRLFEDFHRGLWRTPLSRTGVEPFRRMETVWGDTPAVDVIEKDKAYEITAELPGMDEKDIEVKLANGTLTIMGEKQEDKEEKQKNYYLSERRYGSFRRSFQIPDGVDADKIEATFQKGVLTIAMPKKPEALAGEKKVAIKPA